MLNHFLGEELATIWSKKEIEEIIKHHEDADESEIDEDEERILLGALAFSDLNAQMIATPKPVVYMLDKATKIDEPLIMEIKEKGFSRIPIFSEENKDIIQGVLFVRDLLGVPFSSEHTVGDFIRPDFYP